MQTLCHCIQWTNASEKEEVRQLCAVTYGTVFPIIIAVAIMTNVINVIVLGYLQYTTSPNSARSYLLCLAAIHCLTCFPFIIGLYKQLPKGPSYSSYFWAFYFAHILGPTYNALNYFCVYIIVGLSFDRYSAVCQPHTYHESNNAKRPYIRLCLAFISGCLFYLPYCFEKKPKLDIITKTKWHIGQGWLFHKPFWKVWATIVQTVHRILPAIVMVILNLQIYRSLSRLSKLRHSESRKTNRDKKDRQLFNLLLALTIVFIFTNIPSAAMKMAYTSRSARGFCSLNWSEEVMRAISNVLELSGYCFDFFFYFLMNSEYRRVLQRWSNLVLSSCKKKTDISDYELSEVNKQSK